MLTEKGKLWDNYDILILRVKEERRVGGKPLRYLCTDLLSEHHLVHIINCKIILKKK